MELFGQDIAKDATDTLVFCPFPRSIRYEGIRRVATACYQKLLRDGRKPMLVVPVAGDVPVEYLHISMKEHNSLGSWLLIPIRMLLFMVRLKKHIKHYILLENSPALPLLTIATRLIRYNGRVSSHFLCPVLNTRDVLKAFTSYPRRQILVHLLLNNHLLASISTLLLPKTGFYFVGSAYQKLQLEGYGVRSSTVNPYLHSIVKFTRPAHHKNKPFIIGYLGHFSSIKGVDLLIQAFDDLQTSESLELHIAWSGLGGDKHKITDKIERLYSKNKIHQHGLVKPSEFLAHLDLLVLPYRLNSVPIPPAVLDEAIEVGTRVLVSDVPGLTGPYERSCATFRANDVNSLKNEIIKIIKHG